MTLPLACSFSEASAHTSISTGKERDAEDGLDYFGARYYSSSSGRWLSPDWSAQAEPVPYAKLDDPQSLNLYGYVDNGPVDKQDPNGHLLSLQNYNGGGNGDRSQVSDTTQHSEQVATEIMFQVAAEAAKKKARQEAQQQSFSVTLNLGGVKTKINFSYGNIFSNYLGGMEITADPQNCGSCTWAQVVSRTGVGAQGLTQDGAGVGPLYGQVSPNVANEFSDRPANTAGPGTFTATALVGTANIGGKSFSAAGAMTYGYSINANGSVRMTITPRAATPSEMNGAIRLLQSNSPNWQIR